MWKSCFGALALLSLVGWFSSGSAAGPFDAGPPVNDEFDSRFELRELPAIQHARNIGAAAEDGEPPHAGQEAARSVWWSWKAPGAGTLDLEAMGADFAPALAAYTGGGMSSLTEIGADAAEPESDNTSRLAFTVQKDREYAIVVDGVDGGQGTFRLSASFAPSGPPRHQLIIPEELLGLVELHIDPPPDDDGLYSNRTSLLIDVVPLPGSPVAWPESNPIDLVITRDFCVACEVARISGSRMDNDGMANPATITGNGTLILGSNFQANLELEPGEPDHAAVGRAFDERTAGARAARSVWWNWTAEADGVLILERRHAFQNAVFAVYEGNDIEETSLPIASNLADTPGDLDAGTFRRSTVDSLQTPVRQGVHYRIAVASFMPPGAEEPVDRGTYVLELAFIPRPPNDRFENRIPITDFTLPVEGNNLGAEIEPEAGEIALRDDYAYSVWWSWTPQESGWVTVTTNGSTFDSFIAVYEGDSLEDLEIVAHGDTSPRPERAQGSRATFLAEAGVEYSIVVAGARMETDARAGDRPHPENSGRIVLHAKQLAITAIDELQSSLLADGASAFAGNVRVDNFSKAAAGDLRIRLIARPGYSQVQGIDFLTKTAASYDQYLGTFAIPGLAGDATESISVRGVAPPPYETAAASGVGWGVFAILEERFGDQWFKVDDAWLMHSLWPEVAGISGPGGGVIRLNPGVQEQNREVFDLVIVDEERKPVTEGIVLKEGEQRTFTAVAFFTPVSSPFAQPINAVNCPSGCEVWALTGGETYLQTEIEPASMNRIARIDASRLEQSANAELLGALTFGGKTIETRIPVELIADPEIRFTSIHVDDGILILEVEGTFPAGAALEATADFQTWTPVDPAVQPNENGALSFPIPNDPAGFFRLRWNQ